MTRLRSLSLISDGITDKGLIHLKPLAKDKLRHWQILSRGVTDAGLDHLKGMTNLRSLDLCSTLRIVAAIQKARGYREGSHGPTAN